jgi:hypothetical protein
LAWLSLILKDKAQYTFLKREHSQNEFNHILSKYNNLHIELSLDFGVRKPTLLRVGFCQKYMV